MSLENELRDLIVAKFGTVANFVRLYEIPYSTFKSIMTRGIMNANVDNVLKICSALEISADELGNGKIVSIDNLKAKKIDVEDFALNFGLKSPDSFLLDDEELTSDELKLLSDSLEVTIGIIRKRRNVKSRYIEFINLAHNYQESKITKEMIEHAKKNSLTAQDIEKRMKAYQKYIESENNSNDSTLLQSIDKRTES